MSRVFEALSKASADKNRQAEMVPKPVPLEVFSGIPQVNGNGPSPARRAESNAKFHDNPVAVVPPASTSSPASKSWRERIEELFFGWDLSRYENYPIVALDRDSPAAEQYKILREQIKRLRTEAGIQTFTVTSPVKRDGKTTVAVNLAAVLALDYEQKVLLIDGDLRAPGVHRYFKAPQSPGLTDYLSSHSQMSIKSFVQETFLPGLKILPSGKPSHFASELLAKERMKDVLEEARADFPGYQIIIDSPPILSTPDPLVIAGHVDGVLVVVRAGKTPREYLTKALQTLNSSKVMGVVLNGAEMGMASKYYYYTTSNDL